MTAATGKHWKGTGAVPRDANLVLLLSLNGNEEDRTIVPVLNIAANESGFRYLSSVFERMADYARDKPVLDGSFHAHIDGEPIDESLSYGMEIKLIPFSADSRHEALRTNGVSTEMSGGRAPELVAELQKTLEFVTRRLSADDPHLP